MAEHLTILDRSRKAVLALPSGALHLWLCYWMNEDDEKESYASQGEIKTQTGLSIPTIVAWTKYLVRQGWLVPTGKTAYDKLLARGKMPSANSKQVIVYRVNDPTPKKSLGVPLKNFEGYTTKNILDKVSCSGSGFDSGSCSSTPTNADNAWAGEQEEEKVKGNTKTQTNGKTKSGHRAAADGTPWPEGFDSKWSNLQRTNWLKLHDGSVGPQAGLKALEGQLHGNSGSFRQTFDDPFFDD